MTETKPRKSAKKKRAKKKSKRKTKKAPNATKKEIKNKDSGGTLAQRRAKIRDRYDNPVVTYYDDPPAPHAWIRFIMLARLLGGGLKKGAIIEVAGWEDAGKTSFSIALAADIQSRAPEGKNHVVMVNYEMAEDRVWWATLGLMVDDDHFTLLRPRNLEEGMSDMADLLKSGEVCAIIVDSVAGGKSRGKAEIFDGWRDPKKGLGAGGGIGLDARQWGEAWAAVKGMLVEYDAICIAVNQVRVKIDMGAAPKKGYGPPSTTTPGGAALRFYAWIRLELTGLVLLEDAGGGKMKARKDVDGKRVKVKVIKNKTSGDERGMAFYDLVRGVGFDLMAELIALCLESGAIKHKGGGNYEIGPKVKIRGRAKLRAWIENNEKARAVLNTYVDRWLNKQDDENLEEISNTGAAEADEGEDEDE